MSVVIPVLNAVDTLPQQLEALAVQEYAGDWEVVVADNGSEDGSVEVARRWADRLPGLRIVDAPDRKGINHARNVGAAAAKGDFILFCDADDVAAPGWLAAMAEAGRDCDLVGGRLDEETLNDPVTRAWRGAQPDDALPVALGFLPYATGANCGMRASVLSKLGGFDESYERGASEVEFFWRAQLASYQLCFVPGAVMRYRHRQGLRALLRQSLRFGQADVKLYRAFADQGVQREPLRQTLRYWRWILRNLTDLFGSSEQRGEWLQIVAHRCGRIYGSMRNGVLFP